MSYYESIVNANNHPLRQAYRLFESEKQACMNTMSMNETAHRNYVEALERLERLNQEQQQLLTIMASDLCADLVVQRRRGNHENS